MEEEGWNFDNCKFAEIITIYPFSRQLLFQLLIYIQLEMNL